jgi:hypothetical protein
MLQAALESRLAPWIAAALALAAALPAAAQDPETAFARYHRAAVAGDVNEMMRYASDEQRADLAAMSPAQRAAMSKMAAATMPRGFTVRDKQLSANGQSARLRLLGLGPGIMDGKPEKVYGTAQLLRQRGEWKVANVDWTNQDPGPAAAPAPANAKAKPAISAAHGAAPVGSLQGEPVKKFGRQRPPCVYKPVMTQEDIDNCK